MTGEETLSVEARLIADLGVQVARLTQQVAFRDMIIKELKHEVKTEREAVVAYLREHWSEVLEQTPQQTARIIEHGEHRKEEEK